MISRALFLLIALAACSGSPAAEQASEPAVCAEDAPSPWSHSVPDEDIDEAACASATYPLGPSCEKNSDCGLCHDGSSCGVPATRDEIARLGAGCCNPPAAECPESLVVRCCAPLHLHQRMTLES